MVMARSPGHSGAMGPTRIEPADGQESVWDYPRPPVIVPDGRLVEVRFAGAVVARTTAACRVLETSQAPAWYLPPEDVDTGLLVLSAHRPTFCEWKGVAGYHDIVVGDHVATAAAWTYDSPTPPFSSITGWFAFYCGRVDQCSVAGVVVSPNDGDFYGGWITPDVVGPFKGASGTSGW